MGTIYEAIAHIRDTATTEKDKGTQFERLTRFFLKNDPLWKTRFSDVWMWDNSPTNDGADIGIDLVALDREDGSYWAIQCKCYDDDSTLHYSSVGTFFGKAGIDGTYAHTMIVTTAAKYSDHLDSVAENWKTVRIFTNDMAESDIDYSAWIEGRPTSIRTLKGSRPHQLEAIEDCLKGFETNDRGQLIMACGTGKTVTALRLTEDYLAKIGQDGGFVLFLAPSIALVGQAMREWANQAKLPVVCAVVCSDAKASHVDEDTWESSLKDLPYPASTQPEILYEQMKCTEPNCLKVVFSTYQSIQVVSDAQKMGMEVFDLIICDEAHRTTGMANQNKPDEASEFVKVHDNSIVNGKKRLYMTATPRIYGDRAMKAAKEDSYIVSSMDDESTFGPVFHRLTFGRAIDENLLTDYKVIALTVSEDAVSEAYQRTMAKEDDGFKIAESASIIGCWKGLLDQGQEDGHRLKNAVAFCSTIAESKRITDYFQKTVDAFIDYEKEQGNDYPEFHCKLDHVDGMMDSNSRRDKVQWLENTESGENAACHILSNARCLSEGVDVPSLDAVMFLQPKKSRIDIIQAVGRVMRKFAGKQFGYIILPIVIPAGATAEQALDDNETYAIVWDVLKALRSHDERLDAKINALPYDKKKAKPVVEVIDGVHPLGKHGKQQDDKKPEDREDHGHQMDLLDQMSPHKLQEAVNALIVKKCGTKVYWDVWAKDIAQIAKRHIHRITEIIQSDAEAKKEFDKFLRGLKDSLNDSITEGQAVEMLAQHIITLPVFEALFAGTNFASSNPVSVAMEIMLKVLRKNTLETPAEQRELRDLYASVRMRAQGIKTDAGRQAVIKDLYESFFKEAFKETAEKMGIVYTPYQVVDYILHATDRLLYREFGQHLCDEGVHILDAFTGTGTFIVDLINDKELMPDDKLPYKYHNEIHCNEIMLLAYYIACINIEHAYHGRIGGEYEAFPGAVLTDTFQMYEENDQIDIDTFIENSERVLKQMETPIHVLIGNPPWSIGQESANDNNANENYPTLDKRIEETYAASTDAVLKKGLYDSYVRAFRWATDRIGDMGIVAFVTNGGWIRSGAGAGFRRCLAEEFNAIYVLDLRGNQRTQGELSKKEGGKIFGSGSRAPVAITFLVRNQHSNHKGIIHYYDIGDYLSRETKLSMVAQNIHHNKFEWEVIVPDEYGDWIEQRTEEYSKFGPIGLEKLKNPMGIYATYSMGVSTNRDAWVYSYSKTQLIHNVENTISFYNCERVRWNNSTKTEKLDDFVIRDTQRISWTRGLKNRLRSNTEITYSGNKVRRSMYRPFCKQYLYYDEHLIEMPLRQMQLFPNDRRCKNIEIVVSGVGHSKSFSCLIVDEVPCLDLVEKGQAFPYYYYFKDEKDGLVRKEAITDAALREFRTMYPAGMPGVNGSRTISKEDIFYYIYGILHSPEYRQRFATNLKKELPRIPLAEDFAVFSSAGRALAELHLNYESAELYPLTVVGDAETPGRVEKLHWGKRRNSITGKIEADKTVLVYNRNLMLKDIPDLAHDYVVNGRSPLEWMIDRYQVKTDKDSGIVNDPNQYSEDPRYISDLVMRLVTVSVETMKIVNSLPKINEKDCKFDLDSLENNIPTTLEAETHRRTKEPIEGQFSVWEDNSAD